MYTVVLGHFSVTNMIDDYINKLFSYCKVKYNLQITKLL